MDTSNSNFDDYHTNLVSRLRREHGERRAADKETEEKLLNADTEIVDPDGISTRSADLAIYPPLEIDGVYLYPEENSKNHRTTKFQLVERGTAIFRRGQSFFMALKTAERQFDEANDSIRLAFNFGPAPSPGRSTQYILKVKSGNFPREDNTWAARIVGHDEHAISLEIRIGPETCVGIWKCLAETTLRGGKPKIYQSPEDIYILFNPWERDDSTYMADPDLLNEYVLEDHGKIWVGPHGSSRGRQWIFGQFDDSVLPLVMIILDKSGLPFASRGNPILVSRALSKMVNSNDDNGIVVGRWDGKYKDGQAPSAWTGSVPILEEYFQSMKPVKYGQCWVFSGVLCTVCRAVGIPCRVVSNLVSAHDANATLTIDTYFDEENEEIDSDPHNPTGGKDSIWNFHVWNDAWMARPDLPKGYGGWQAIDSTPQETSEDIYTPALDGLFNDHSQCLLMAVYLQAQIAICFEGMFQCGPASLEAVRKGQAGFAYDVPFVLAEVNADYIKWRIDKSAEFGYSRVTSDKYHIGRMILTKQPNFFDPTGDTDRQDIVSEYKGKEGTRSERLALYNAVRGTSRAPMFFEVPTDSINDVDFDLIDLDRVAVGEPFSVIVTIHNKSTEVRSVHADLSAASIYYTGVRANVVKRATSRFHVQPESREELKLSVSPNEYMDKLVEYGIMKIFAICHVDQTKQSWSEEDDFQVIKPVLNLEISPDLQVGKTGTVTFKFTNPIKRVLTQCRINYEGPGLTRFGTIQLKDIPSESEFSFTQSFIPRSIGTQRWVATFTSKELIDIVGSAVVDISP